MANYTNLAVQKLIFISWSFRLLGGHFNGHIHSFSKNDVLLCVHENAVSGEERKKHEIFLSVARLGRTVRDVANNHQRIVALWQMYRSTVDQVTGRNDNFDDE